MEDGLDERPEHIFDGRFFGRVFQRFEQLQATTIDGGGDPLHHGLEEALL